MEMKKYSRNIKLATKTMTTNIFLTECLFLIIVTVWKKSILVFSFAEFIFNYSIKIFIFRVSVL